MVRFAGPMMALLSALSLASSGVAASDTKRAPEVVPNSYVVRLKPADKSTREARDLGTHSAFKKRAEVEGIPLNVTHEFDGTIMLGFTVTIDSADAEDLRKLPEVDSVFPNYKLPGPRTSGAGMGTAPKSHIGRQKSLRPTGGAGAGADVNPHDTTGVKELHRQGIKGRGVRIGLIDSGIDYKHPALGGCFGPGCRVSFGYDFVGETYKEIGIPTEDDDPISECAEGGHGTHVAGIIMMDDSAHPAGEGFGLVGVAPEAEIGMYRTSGCDTDVPMSALLAALERAVADSVDIISISIGGIGAWSSWYSLNPVLEAIEEVDRRGIAVVIAAGNSGPDGMRTLFTPGVSLGAFTVASSEAPRTPVYTATDSKGFTFKYGSTFPVDAASLPVVLVGAGNRDTEHGCNLALFEDLAASLSNPKDFIVAIRRGGPCYITDAIEHAREVGFVRYLLLADFEGDDITQKDLYNNYFGIVLNGTLTQSLSISGDADSKTIYDNLRASSPGEYRLSFARSGFEVRQIMNTGSHPSNFSSIGPSWEMDFKPQISAPGGQVLATFPLAAGGYAVLSGTSMATPYVTGCIALVKSRFPDMPTREIYQLLQSTATRMSYVLDNSLVDGTAVQGAGLVNPLRAIQAKSAALIVPSQLRLGGTGPDGHVQKEISITNRLDRPVTYTLSHIPAALMRTRGYPDLGTWTDIDAQRLYGVGRFSSYASMTASPATVTVPANSSRNVTISLAAPNDQQPEWLPVYSGFVTVRADDGTAFSVPYMGVPSEVETTPVIDTTDVTGSKLPAVSLTSNNASLGNAAEVNFDPAKREGLTIASRITQPTVWSRIDVVHANTSFVPTTYGFDTDVAVPLAPSHMPVVGTIGGLDIVGTISAIDYIYPSGYVIRLPFSGTMTTPDGMDFVRTLGGSYRIVIRALRMGMDPERAESWDSWMSGVFTITVPEVFLPGMGPV